MKYCLGLAILVCGFSGIIGQILLLRELLITFSGNELTIGIILANWLILEAIGSLYLGRIADRIKNKIELFVGITILFSLSLPMALYLTRILKLAIGVSLGEGLGFLPILYSSFLILLPVSITHGGLFALGCKLYSVFFRPDASSVGKVYVYETIGTIIGGIVFTYILILYLNSFQIAIWVLIINLLTSLILLLPSWKISRLRKTAIAITGLLFFSIYLILSGGVDRLHWLSIKAQWKGHKVIHYQNSMYGNICATQSGGQYTFFIDGIPSIIIPIPDIEFVEEFVDLAMLIHPDPERILILGGGAGGVINEVLKHPSVKTVDYTELDPLLLEVIRRFHTPLTDAELNDPRVRIIPTDGRFFLKKTPAQYDIVLVGPSNPSDLQINRLFTREFFSLVKERLNEDGILVINLPGSLTYLSDELRDLNGCIFTTLKGIYPYVRVIPGGGKNLYLSSKSIDLSLIGREGLIQRLKERDLKVNLLLPWHIEHKLRPEWLDWFLETIEGGNYRVNRDFQPIGLFYSISHWNALFSPYLCGLFRYLGKLDLKHLLILSTIFTFIFLSIQSKKRSLNPAIGLSIVTTGFAGMIFSLLLIFTFQSVYGYLFHWFGLLVTGFMAGAAAGGMVMTLLLTRIKRDLNSLIKIELAIVSFSFILPLTVLFIHPYSDHPSLKVFFLAASFLCGLLIGGEFPLANKMYLKDGSSLGKTVGILYCCDLFGGWLGGIIGGVVLLPVLGFLQTCMVVAILKLSSLVILSLSGREVI